MGKPGVPSWIDAAGGGQGHRSATAGSAVAQEWDEAGPVGGSSRLQAAMSRMLAYGLWGGIALAVVLGLVNCVGPAASTTPPAAGPDQPAPAAPPGGCAELVVSAWLAGDTGLLAGVPGVPRRQPEPGRRQATRTYTAGVTPGAGGAWGYLVGAEVQRFDPDAQQWRAVGTQFFTVTMVPAAGGCQGWSPAALPAQVPSPRLAGDPADGPQAYQVSLPTSDTELSQTLAAFFAGMLAGAGDLERYVAPGVAVSALSPPPYQEVSVTELRARVEPADPVPPDGTVMQLLATVTTDPDDLPLVYPVTVGVRGGRWEVIALDPLVGAATGQPAGAVRSTNNGG
jgi:hypothetical protein